MPSLRALALILVLGLFTSVNGLAMPSASSRGFVFDYTNDSQVNSVGSGGTRATYAYDAGTGRLSSAGRGLQTASWEYDALGRVSQISTTVSGGGSYAYGYGYNAWNLRTSRSATIGVSWSGLGYDGQNCLTSAQLSNGTGYTYDYDARGKWQSEDPIQESGGPNLYAYVGNGPIGAVDPLGLDYATSWGASGAVAGAGVALGGSAVADFYSGGLNLLITPGEIATGAAIGGGIGYGLGWVADSAQSAGQSSQLAVALIMNVTGVAAVQGYFASNSQAAQGAQSALDNAIVHVGYMNGGGHGKDPRDRWFNWNKWIKEIKTRLNEANKKLDRCPKSKRDELKQQIESIQKQVEQFENMPRGGSQ